MGKAEGIRIYLRLRPPATAQHSSILGGVARNAQAGTVDTASCDYHIENGFHESKVRFHVDKRLEADYVNNASEDYVFSFRHIFEPAADQLAVFNTVAKGCVLSALEGYNSTIFAYGQTGSGKTYSITGGTESYEERGIIPRALGLIYEEVARRHEFVWSVAVSYLQIYNDKGQDLLNNGKDAKTLDDLPAVTVHETEEGTTVLRNLEQHAAPALSDALDLLFLGDMNRLYCETPMNRTSSRSHCVFTVLLEARAVGSSVVRRSKLNLVDLAGSERVSKTGVHGTILSEAKHINLSLHHLAHVIVALSEQAQGTRSHVPFRNAFITMVLRDSLGGNCRTSMLATAHLAKATLPETISTCGFAQRVARIRQEARVNEEVDPLALVAKLRREVAQLKDQLAFYQGGGGEGKGADRALSEEEKSVCRGLVDAYVRQPDPPQHRLDGFEGDLARIYFCFEVLRERVVGRAGDTAGPTPALDAGAREAYEAQIARLQLSLQQRENEVNTMFELVSRGPGGARFNAATQTPTGADEHPASPRPAAAAVAAVAGAMSRVAELSQRGRLSVAEADVAQEYLRRKEHVLTTSGGVAPGVGVAGSVSPAPAEAGSGPASGYKLDALADATLVEDRAAAFDAFKQSCTHYTAVESMKVELKVKYDTCKQTAAALNSTVDAIKDAKTRVQRLRAERAVAGVDEADPLEENLMQELAASRERYNTLAASLRAQKETIDGMHAFMKRAQDQLARDFELWFAARRKQVTLAANGADRDVAPVGAPTSTTGPHAGHGETTRTGASEQSHDHHHHHRSSGSGGGGGALAVSSTPSPAAMQGTTGGGVQRVSGGSAPVRRPPTAEVVAVASAPLHRDGGATAVSATAVGESTRTAAMTERHPASAPSSSTLPGRIDGVGSVAQTMHQPSLAAPLGGPRVLGWTAAAAAGGGGSCSSATSSIHVNASFSSANHSPYLMSSGGEGNHLARNHHLQPLTHSPPPPPATALAGGATFGSSATSPAPPPPAVTAIATAVPTMSNPFAPAHRSTGSRAADEQLAALYKLRDSMRAQML